MSVHRRYDRGRVRELMRKRREFLEEKEKYELVSFNESNAEKYFEEHTNFIILLIIDSYFKNYITKDQALKLIDVAEGYVYAQEEQFITKYSLCNKLNTEIVSNFLCPHTWSQIGRCKR